MDKASDFESEDCGFESRRGHFCDFIICFWEGGRQESDGDGGAGEKKERKTKAEVVG